MNKPFQRGGKTTKKNYKIEVDCANMMEDAAKKTVGVANATVNKCFDGLNHKVKMIIYQNYPLLLRMGHLVSIDGFDY